ncbi:MAG: protein tyrosine phosphatase [Pseudomonadota bacterium]
MRSEELSVGLARTSGKSPGAPRPGQLYVCPLSRVHDTIAETGARYLVTLINLQTMLETPPGIDPANHLKIAVNDIIAPQDGLIHPCEDHVLALLRFAQIWNRQGPLIVHCWAGISRSTAAAFITLCTLNPSVPEVLVARRIREASATAFPNRRLVELADGLLGRGGRMLRAIDEMGPPKLAIEAEPFALPSTFP